MGTNGLLIRNAAQIVTGQGTGLRRDALKKVLVHENACLYAEHGAVVALGDPNAVEACVQGNIGQGQGMAAPMPATEVFRWASDYRGLFALTAASPGTARAPDEDAPATRAIQPE